MKVVKLCLVLTVILLCGCTKQEITSTADELTMYSWSNSDKYDKKITLYFNDDTATIVIYTPEYSGCITGNAIVSNTSLSISDNNLKQNFTFDYVLYGNKVDLKYNGNTIELQKS